MSVNINATARSLCCPIRVGILSRHALFLQAEADPQLSVREGADLAALPG